MTAVDRVFKCPLGHSYDAAREGYVNLHSGRRLGDTAEMLAARRRFLGRGHYEPLSDTINRLVAQGGILADSTSDLPPTVLDAGCGEGYYLGALK